MSRPFAIVTGASSGIGLELAAICTQEGLSDAGRDRERLL
jgi:short-subunit dehydrogenase